MLLTNKTNKTKMISQKLFKSIFQYLVFSFILGFSNNLVAQCAGTDNTVTVCNKDLDVATRTFDLFANLGGTPTAGGTWMAVSGADSAALDDVTGIVDLWAINRFGAHEFQYTNTACGESAIVTIELGGYPGEDNINGGANACNNENDVNLYSFLGSNVGGQVQDFNGTWSEAAPTGFLDDNTFDATQVAPGEYTFLYTVDAVGTCASRQSTIVLEVHKLPTVGTPVETVFCANEDFSTLTNFNLNQLLNGEDTNGTWSQNDVDLPNRFIDIQDIYNNSGTGTYTYDYEILPSNFVCDIANISVSFQIQAVFEATISATDYCAGTPYIVNIAYDDTLVADGSYDIEYLVAASNGNYTLTASSNLSGGTGTFTMTLPAQVPLNETMDLTVIGITSPSGTLFCDLATTPQTTFSVLDINGPPTIQAAADQTFCTNLFDATGPTLADIEIMSTGNVVFFDTETSAAQLPDTMPLVNGEDYFLSSSDPTNSCVVAVRTRVAVVLIIPADPTTTDSTPVFCASDNPTLANLAITGDTIGIITWFDAPTGGNSLANTTALADGTMYYASLVYDGGCESTNRIEVTPTVVGVDSASLQFTTLEACSLDNPTIADLIALEEVSNFDVIWYDQPENGNALQASDLLITGTMYYAESFDPITGCILPARVAVTVDLTNCDPEEYDFFIPDGFSPNGDGRNDTFFIPNIEAIFPDFTLEILNRYGISLFKGDINNPSWDGSSSNGTSPNGVYFYIINYNKVGSEPIQGRLYLNR